MYVQFYEYGFGDEKCFQCKFFCNASLKQADWLFLNFQPIRQRALKQFGITHDIPSDHFIYLTIYQTFAVNDMKIGALKASK